MKEKALALLTCIFISLSILGFIYAQWNDVVVIRNVMTFGDDPDMGFVDSLKCWDNEAPKDVGKYGCYYAELITGTEAYKTLIININNAYPDYEVHCNFTVENVGTLPLHINGTVIYDPTGALTWNSTLSALVDADGKPILNILVTPDLVCNNFLSGEKLEAEIAVHITQNAQECHVYYFQVEIAYEVK